MLSMKSIQGFTFPMKCIAQFKPKNQLIRFLSTNSEHNEGRKSAAVLQDKEKRSGTNEKIEISLLPPKGTRDFYPEDQRLKDWLFNIWKQTAKSYGFEEYDAPVVEHIELYKRKAGEEVTEQLYDFHDKSKRHLSLRPEMTPSLARMVIAKSGNMPSPIKWFAIPQCWRYERMTRGRRREHYQWNMDIMDIKGVEAEAELLSAIVTSFRSMGLSAQQVGIKINDRKLLNDLMKKVGIPEEKWIQTCIIIDKLDKVKLFDLQEDILSIGLDMSVMKELTQYMQLTSLTDYEELLGKQSEGVQEIQYLMSLLTSYGIEDWIEFDPKIVRGLAYYTGVVFEGFDRKKEFRAICGGGRYDKLIESFGGHAMPAVGFGFGDAVIVEVLKAYQLLPDVSKNNIDIVAYAMTSTLRYKMNSLVMQLRQQKYSVDVVLDERKPKWVFQKANKLGASYVMMLGEDEDKEGKVTLKNMSTGHQIQCSYGDIISHLQTQL